MFHILCRFHKHNENFKKKFLVFFDLKLAFELVVANSALSARILVIPGQYVNKQSEDLRYD